MKAPRLKFRKQTSVYAWILVNIEIGMYQSAAVLYMYIIIHVHVAMYIGI